MKDQPLRFALGFNPQVSLTSVWDICHLLSLNWWTMKALSVRLNKKIVTMEKTIDRAARLCRAAGITIIVERTNNLGVLKSARYAVKDTRWQHKLERLRLTAKRRQRTLRWKEAS